jgi:beta-galactosidase
MAALLVVVGLTASAGAGDAGRRVEKFCDAWTFHLGDMDGAELPSFDDSSWRTLDLPHDWSIEQTYEPTMPGGPSVGYLPGGVGWYRKSFTLPESDIGKEIAIDFDGVYMDSQVWINGILLGRRPNGYVGFRYDLTPYLKFGKEQNHIAVRVNVEPHGSRWYPGAGIYRNVWLTKMNPVHVAHWGTYVTTPEVTKEKATVRLRTEVENKTGDASDVVLSSIIVDPQGTTVANAETSQRIAAGAMFEFDQQFVVTNPNLWSPDTPDLYQVVSMVKTGGKTVDEVTSPLGIRIVEFTSDRGFFLNGEHVDIKGVCLHHDFGAIGAAINTRALERQLEILRDMGANAIRTSHNPREPEFYAMCDRMGFMVMNEAFDVWEQKKLGNDYHQFFKEWHERDLTSMIRRDRNHPCVIIWSIGNEMNEQHKEDFPGQGGVIAKRLVEICRQHDPSRVVTAALNSPEASDRTGITAALDVYGQNYNLITYPKLKDKKPMIGTENATSFITRDSYSYEMVDDRGLKLAIQNIKSNSECTGYGKFWGNDRTEGTLIVMRKSPWVAGQFAWTGFDYLGECFPFRWPARNGLFGIVDLAGFPKDSYYIYQADWTDEPTVHIVPQTWKWTQFIAPIPVWIYSNCEEVELFLNNRSLGVKQINRAESLHAEWMVNFEPGELKAIGRTGGQAIYTNIVRTAGKPVRLDVIADRTEIAADGSDLSYLKIRLLDEHGVVSQDSDRMLQVSVTGAGTLAGVDNGHHMNHASFKGNQVMTSYGLALAIVKSTKNAGVMQVNISADGVEGGKVAITTLPTDDVRLTAAATNRNKLFRERNKKYSRHRLAEIRDDGLLVDAPLALEKTGETVMGAGKLVVAPVFKHGSGQHADSVVASRNKKPPTWSENDARYVVVDEARKLGIEFAVAGEMPMGFDGVNKSRSIVFEILTGEDVPDRIDNTDRITDFHGAAEQRVTELKTKNGPYVVGVFYDPLVGKGDVADDEPLRQQVRDFIAWLKSEKHPN